MRYLVLIVCCLMTAAGYAQTGSFRAEAAAEVAPDRPFAVRVVLENVAADGELALPDFAPLTLVGGPQTSSNFSMINGEVSRSTTYTYYLQADREGTFVVPAFGIETSTGWQQTEPIKVTVRAGATPPATRRAAPALPGFEDFFEPQSPSTPQRRPRRRRKTYRI